MKTPINQNQLQATKFQLIFPRISTAEYFCQSVNLPGISAEPIQQTTTFVPLYRPGNKTSYNSFVMSFIVDEDLAGYRLIHDWIRGYSFPTDFSEYRKLKRSNSDMGTAPPQYSDATLTILSALNNSKIRINFIEIFPVGLSDINFETTSSANSPIVAQATFKYQYYNIEIL